MRQRYSDWGYVKKPLTEQTVRPWLLGLMIVAAAAGFLDAAGIFATAIFLPWEVRPPLVFSPQGTVFWGVATVAAMVKEGPASVAFFAVGLFFWVKEYVQARSVKGDFIPHTSQSSINASHIVEELRNE